MTLYYIVVAGFVALLTKRFVDQKQWGWAAWSALTCIFFIARMPQP